MKFHLFGFMILFWLLLIWLVSFSFIYLLICFDSSLPFSLYILPPLLLKCGQGCVGPQQRASKVSLSCKQFTLISLTFISFFFFIQTRLFFSFFLSFWNNFYCFFFFEIIVIIIIIIHFFLFHFPFFFEIWFSVEKTERKKERKKEKKKTRCCPLSLSLWFLCLSFLHRFRHFSASFSSLFCWLFIFFPFFIRRSIASANKSIINN